MTSTSIKPTAVLGDLSNFMDLLARAHDVARDRLKKVEMTTDPSATEGRWEAEKWIRPPAVRRTVWAVDLDLASIDAARSSTGDVPRDVTEILRDPKKQNVRLRCQDAYGSKIEPVQPTDATAEAFKNVITSRLYVSALRMIQTLPPEHPYSFFKLGAVHSLSDELLYKGGYCVHGSQDFGSWHFFYCLAAEQAYIFGAYLAVAVEILRQSGGVSSGCLVDEIWNLYQPYLDRIALLYGDFTDPRFQEDHVNFLCHPWAIGISRAEDEYFNWHNPFYNYKMQRPVRGQYFNDFNDTNDTVYRQVKLAAGEYTSRHIPQLGHIHDDIVPAGLNNRSTRLVSAAIQFAAAFIRAWVDKALGVKAPTKNEKTSESQKGPQHGKPTPVNIDSPAADVSYTQGALATLRAEEDRDVSIQPLKDFLSMQARKDRKWGGLENQDYLLRCLAQSPLAFLSAGVDSSASQEYAISFGAGADGNPVLPRDVYAALVRVFDQQHAANRLSQEMDYMMKEYLRTFASQSSSFDGDDPHRDEKEQLRDALVDQLKNKLFNWPVRDMIAHFLLASIDRAVVHVRSKLTQEASESISASDIHPRPNGSLVAVLEDLAQQLADGKDPAVPNDPRIYEDVFIAITDPKEAKVWEEQLYANKINSAQLTEISIALADIIQRATPEERRQYYQEHALCVHRVFVEMESAIYSHQRSLCEMTNARHRMVRSLIDPKLKGPWNDAPPTNLPDTIPKFTQLEDLHNVTHDAMAGPVSMSLYRRLIEQIYLDWFKLWARRRPENMTYKHFTNRYATPLAYTDDTTVKWETKAVQGHDKWLEQICGSIGFVPLAGFDPIFFFIHCNVERQFLMHRRFDQNHEDGTNYQLWVFKRLMSKNHIPAPVQRQESDRGACPCSRVEQSSDVDRYARRVESNLLADVPFRNPAFATPRLGDISRQFDFIGSSVKVQLNDKEIEVPDILNFDLGLIPLPSEFDVEQVQAAVNKALESVRQSEVASESVEQREQRECHKLVSTFLKEYYEAAALPGPVPQFTVDGKPTPYTQHRFRSRVFIEMPTGIDAVQKRKFQFAHAIASALLRPSGRELLGDPDIQRTAISAILRSYRFSNVFTMTTLDEASELGWCSYKYGHLNEEMRKYDPGALTSQEDVSSMFTNAYTALYAHILAQSWKTGQIEYSLKDFPGSCVVQAWIASPGTNRTKTSAADALQTATLLAETFQFRSSPEICENCRMNDTGDLRFIWSHEEGSEEDIRARLIIQAASTNHVCVQWVDDSAISLFSVQDECFKAFWDSYVEQMSLYAQNAKSGLEELVRECVESKEPESLKDEKKEEKKEDTRVDWLTACLWNLAVARTLVDTLPDTAIFNEIKQRMEGAWCSVIDTNVLANSTRSDFISLRKCFAKRFIELLRSVEYSINATTANAQFPQGLQKTLNARYVQALFGDVVEAHNRGDTDLLVRFVDGGLSNQPGGCKKTTIRDLKRNAYVECQNALNTHMQRSK